MRGTDILNYRCDCKVEKVWDHSNGKHVGTVQMATGKDHMHLDPGSPKR